MIRDFYTTITELEVILCISSSDYTNRDIVSSLDDIKKRLSLKYSMDFSKTVSEDMYDDNFNKSLDYIYNRLCGDYTFFEYIGETPVNLRNVKYFGTTRTSLTALLTLLSSNQVPNGFDNAMEHLRLSLLNISMCLEKKLMMCLYVSYNLNLSYLTGVIAKLLYTGMKG